MKSMTVSQPFHSPLGRPIRLGVLLSGGGSTLVNFLQKIDAGELDAEVPIVIASRTDCLGVTRARDAGLETVVIRRRDFSGVNEFSDAIFSQLDQANVDLVVLAGFLSLIHIPDEYQMRVINIHPALIPMFCGKGYFGHHVHEAVIERGTKISGCTVHFADNVYDHGPIILQQSVPVLDDDTPVSLAARVFEAECEAYPQAISLVAKGRLRVEGHRVRILDE